VLKGKLGRVAMEASQPRAFRLPAALVGSDMPSVSTMVKLVLRFDPAEESSPPPRLGSVSSKLKIATHYAASPRNNFPSRASLAIDMTQGYISEFASLSSICIASVDWRKHESWESPESRRDSAVSTASTMRTVRSMSEASIMSNTVSTSLIPEPTTAYKGKSFYSATVLVPLSLPTNKHFVPSFHTCLISRVYGVHLNLSCNGQALGPSFTLKLPVQISSEGSVTGEARRRQSMFAEQATLDTEAAFEPRNTGPPPDAFLGRSQLGGRQENELPGYASQATPFHGMMRPQFGVTSVSVLG